VGVKRFKAEQLREKRRIYQAKLRKNPEYKERQRLVSNAYNAKHREERLAYQNAQQKMKREIIESFKTDPCKDCGQSFPIYCMDFDHVVREKKDNISNMHKNRTIKAILEEIAKCELVCANCHRIRTHQRLAVVDQA
jgi:hypothetical protein